MTKRADQPFALLGVNVNGYDAKALGEAMRRLGLTWRTFADPGPVHRGATTRRWNISAIPVLYVIDHQGVIRHKWVGPPGEAAIDEALDHCIRAAELDRKGPPK